MKREFAALSKQTLIYGISPTVAQVVGLITLPIFARVFTPAEYGELELVTIAVLAMVALADLGFVSASQRSYFDYSPDQARARATALSTAIIVTLTAALAIAFIVSEISQPISNWLFKTPNNATLVAVAALCVPAQIAAVFLREALRLNFRAVHYGIGCAISALVTGTVGIVAVLVFKLGVTGVVLGNLIGNVAGATYGCCVSARYFSLSFSRIELERMLKFGLPLIPASAALWGLSLLDRVMLSKLGNFADVGEYAIATRLAVPVMFIFSAFSLAYSPFTLAVSSRDPDLEKRVRARTLTYLASVLVFVTVTLSLFAREIISVVAPQFNTAHKLVGLICMGTVMFGVSAITMSGISIMRKSHYFSIYSLIAVAINIGLNFALIPSFGAYGAGLATLVGYTALAALYYRKSQTIYRTPYETRKTLVVLGLGSLIIPAGLLPIGLSTGVKVLALIAFVIGLRLFGVISKSEMLEAHNTVRHFVRRPKPTEPVMHSAHGT